MKRKQYYLLKAGNLEFYAILDNESISVGNPTVNQSPCVRIAVEEEYLELVSVNFRELCSLDKQMPSGENGTILMMKVAIQFAINKFPQITRIRLTDTSGFYASPNNHIDLHTQSYLLHGKTWYQKHLPSIQLTPVGDADANLLTDYNNALKTVKKYKKHPYFRDDAIFQQSSSWADYFQTRRLESQDWLYQRVMVPIIRQVFKLPTLHGITWKGEIPQNRLILHDVLYTKIKKPDEMVIQWGGKQNELGPYDQLGML
jgi:hypothetical protein